MGKKGRKTRWRPLPIPIGTGTGGRGGADEDQDPVPVSTQPPAKTYNEDEYTKITTPRQDMLFKKGYLGRKKTAPPPTESAPVDETPPVGEWVDGLEQYCCEDQIPPPQYIHPAGYMDSNGPIYYMHNYEVYDPYTGGVTVVVGPAPGYGHHPALLAALPCHPVPLQPLEWFSPHPPHHPSYTTTPLSRKKSTNSIDSQNWSGQSSESCPPGSPQDTSELPDQQYVYPGYMFGPPVYNLNGVNVQGVVPPTTQSLTDQAKRRKKRRRRRRGGVTDDGSESSCEEALSVEAAGSVSSKTNSDSGIATDPCQGGQGSLSSLSNDEGDKSIPRGQDDQCKSVLSTDELPQQAPTDTTEETCSHDAGVITEVENCQSGSPVGLSVDATSYEPKTNIELLPPVSEKIFFSENTAETCSSENIAVEEEIVPKVPSPDVLGEETFNEPPTQVFIIDQTSTDPTEDIIKDETQNSNSNATKYIEERCESFDSDVLSQKTNENSEESLCYEELSKEESVYESTESSPAKRQSEDILNISEQDESLKEMLKENESPKLPRKEEIQERQESSSETPTPKKKNVETNESSGKKQKEGKKHSEAKQKDSESNQEVSAIADQRPKGTQESRKKGGRSRKSKHKAKESPPECKPKVEVEIKPQLEAKEEPPVPPPRRKRSVGAASRLGAAEKLGARMAEEIVIGAAAEAAERWPITAAVAKWLEDSEDEEEAPLTGQKNGEGNPFPAPFHSGAGTRVAISQRRRTVNGGGECEWRGVDKYYRLALPVRSGPFPCGVCCILQ